RLVPRMNVTIVVLAGERLAVQARFIEALAVKDDLCSRASHSGDLSGVGRFGYDDSRFDAEELCGVRHRLAVIAGRSGDDSPRSFFVAELRYQVYTTAHFERADRLMVFMLDEDLGAD